VAGGVCHHQEVFGLRRDDDPVGNLIGRNRFVELAVMLYVVASSYATCAVAVVNIVADGDAVLVENRSGIAIRLPSVVTGEDMLPDKPPGLPDVELW